MKKRYLERVSSNLYKGDFLVSVANVSRIIELRKQTSTNGRFMWTNRTEIWLNCNDNKKNFVTLYRI